MMDSDEWSIFPLTDNLSSSFVDPQKLIAFESSLEHRFPIGMKNFRSKPTQTTSPSAATKSFLQNPIGSVTPTTNGATPSLARMRWKSAANKVKHMNDPWAEFKLDATPAENVIRHRYNAIKKQWKQDECTVKMETTEFDRGAMRACYRLKKLSNFVHKTSWEHASNYVAKSYMDPEVPRERYFDDVKLQMDAKLWAEMYNRHNPPKKIDMFQVSILEFKDRPNKPLFHLEHFIDGHYIKYNSNSGFVEDVHVRFTPHAFSHFTFESSNHELIVVDIQGVGDLYTDPQIHTVAGSEYGDGNLGVKGFALFFSSHICNQVCRSLGLTQFDLAPSEMKSHGGKLVASSSKKCNLTQSRGMEEMVVGSPCSYGEYFRQRYRRTSNNSACSDDNSNSTDLPDIDESEGYESYESPTPMLSPNSAKNQGNGHHFLSRQNSDDFVQQSRPISMTPLTTSPIQIMRNAAPRPARARNESCCLDSAFSMDEAMNFFNSKDISKPRPSCVIAERDLMNNLKMGENDDDEDENDDLMEGDKTIFEDESVLGKIHLEMCKYHEMGRFVASEEQHFDVDAAFFHLKQAANLGVVEALVNIGKIYLDLPRDILPNYTMPENESNFDIAFDYIRSSANKGDKNSLSIIAKTYDTGSYLNKKIPVDWHKAIEFYQKLIDLYEDEACMDDPGYFETSGAECEPIYTLLARIGEMKMSGGYGVEKDLEDASKLFTEAAEKAMAFGKGRIANKYYMLSEQASSLMD